MNFKDWEKLEETDKSCILRHPKGHVMTIAVKALPKIQQEQIKRLKFAKGGDVLESEDGDGISTQGKDVRHAHKAKMRGDKDEHEMGMHHAKEEAKGRSEMERHNKPKIKGLAHGGELKGEHKNGNVSEGEVRTSKGYWDSEEGKKALARANANAEDTKRRVNHSDKPKKYADGGDVDPNDQGDTQPDATTPAAPTTVINVASPNAQPQLQPQAPQPMAPAPVNPATQYGKQETPVEQPQLKDTVPNVAANGQPNPNAIEANTQTQAENQKNVDIAKGKAQADIEKGYIQGQAENQQNLQGAYNDVKQHVDDFAQYTRANPINPNHYQESMGSGQKVSSAIGLFLGGFGSANQFGGHNYAMDFLNEQIDRDIEGQKSRMDQQKTILGAYQHLYGDGVAAYNATKATMLDIYNHKVQLAAAQLGTPQATAAAQAFAQKTAIDTQKALGDAAVPLSRLAGSNPNLGGAQQAPRGGGQSPKVPGQTNVSSKKGPSSGPGIYKILPPDAASKFQYAQDKYNKTDSEDKKNSTQKEYTAGLKAEKVLNGPNGDGVGGINDIMEQLYQNTGAGSAGPGALMHHVVNKGENMLEATPYVGHALKGAVDLVNLGASSKDYQRNRATMKTDIANALQGLVAPTDVDTIVEPNLPTYRDTPEQVRAKTRTIVNMIRKAVTTPTLTGGKS